MLRDPIPDSDLYGLLCERARQAGHLDSLLLALEEEMRWRHIFPETSRRPTGWVSLMAPALSRDSAYGTIFTELSEIPDDALSRLYTCAVAMRFGREAARSARPVSASRMPAESGAPFPFVILLIILAVVTGIFLLAKTAEAIWPYVLAGIAIWTGAKMAYRDL